MQVLFRLRFCFLFYTFSVEQSNTRTFKIIGNPLVFVAFRTCRRLQIMQSLAQFFSLFGSFLASKKAKQRVPKRFKSVSFSQSIFGFHFSCYECHFGTYLGSLSPIFGSRNRQRSQSPCSFLLSSIFSFFKSCFNLFFNTTNGTSPGTNTRPSTQMR